MLIIFMALLAGCDDEQRPKRLHLGYKQPGTEIKLEEDIYNCGEELMLYLAMVKQYIKAVDNAQKGSTSAVKRADKLIARIQASEGKLATTLTNAGLSKRCEIEFNDKKELFKSAVRTFGEKPPLSKKEQEDIRKKQSCPVLCESRPKSEQDGCLNACIDKENRNYTGD